MLVEDLPITQTDTLIASCCAEVSAGLADTARATLIEAVSLSRVYQRGAETVRALDGVSFSIQEREMVAIVGPSGAGKSTLLHLLGCMDAPTSGTLTIGGRSAKGLSDAALTRMRREMVGFVFQQFGLLPTLTVAENVSLPTLFSRKKAAKLAGELLERVGLQHRMNHRPHELSGGEMQRAAIARALINSPRVLLADEPTGNLDSANGEAIINVFRRLNREGITVIMVTHNEALADSAERKITLSDGKLVSDTRRPER
jgi:ABC-type lipoprotein export system ATPase subunit